jgi:ABC-type phosphate/phosphonate transport system substrate-binding protein
LKNIERKRFVLIPEQNIFQQLERYELLADCLSRKMGTRITLKILPRSRVFDRIAKIP